MTPALACLIGAGAILALGLLAISARSLLQRRRVARAIADVERRMEELARQRSPDELPRADDVSKSTRRRMTRRDAPVLRKRGSRRYGA